MSSKSRKHSSPPRRKSTHASEGHGHGEGHGHTAVEGEVEHAEPSHKDFLEAEDLLKTPKGRNPLVYAGLILMLVFLLLVFILPPSAFDGRRANPVEMRWTHPERGPQEIRSTDFYASAQGFSRLMSMFGQRSNLEQSELARFLISDQLAQDNGITFSDDELKIELGNIARAMGGSRALEARLARFPGGVRGFQESLRSFHRINRYESLLGKLLSVPDGAKLREQWTEQYREWAFDWVYAAAEDFVEAARAEDPDDATLEAWFLERPEFEQNQLKTPERYVAQVIGLELEGDDPERGQALLAAYPLPEDWDDEARGMEYHTRYQFTRFRKEYPEGEAPTDPGELYQTFEEVRDACIAEAKWLHALEALRAELFEKQEAGEAIDLAAEAERTGLALLDDGEPRGVDAWRDLEGLGGQFTSAQMYALQEPGDLARQAVPTEDALLFVRLVEKLPSELPPFAEIRDQVFEDWVEERSAELATASLQGLRDKLAAGDEAAAGDTAPSGEQQPSEDETTEGTDDEDGETASASDGIPTASEDAFRAAAEAAGFDVRRRDWLERSAQEKDDPDWDDPGHTFLRTRYDLYQMEEDQLSEVLDALDGSGAYLVRVVGSRAIPLERMTPKQYQSLVDSTAMRQSFDYLQSSPLSVDVLRDEYGLWLRSEEEAAEREAEEAGQPEP